MTVICLGCTSKTTHEGPGEPRICPVCGGGQLVALPDPQDHVNVAKVESLRTMGVEALVAGHITRAEQCFYGLVEQEPGDWQGWLLLGWTQFAQADKSSSIDQPFTGLPELNRAARLAEPGTLATYAEQLMGNYLTAAAERYTREVPISGVVEITSPQGIDLLSLFQFAYLLTERFDLVLSEAMVQSIDSWIAALAMRLFRQAEYSDIRLRLPVKYLTQQDIETAQALFDWMDAIFDAVLSISARCGEAFFELLTALRLDIAENCMPRLAEVCKTYRFSYLHDHDQVVAEANVAQQYTFMVLETCYRITSFDRRFKRFYVEAVGLLPELKVEWAKSEVWLSTAPRGNAPVETVYGIPESAYQSFVDKARRLAGELQREDREYLLPKYLAESA